MDNLIGKKLDGRYLLEELVGDIQDESDTGEGLRLEGGR